MKTEKELKNVLTLIGGNLAELRLEKGYDSIKEFANKYGLPEIQYWRIENGKTNITIKSLFKILSIHELTLHDFFCTRC